nr:hypothetical protein [Tanacetum cinerariifolium]
GRRFILRRAAQAVRSGPGPRAPALAGRHRKRGVPGRGQQQPERRRSLPRPEPHGRLYPHRGPGHLARRHRQHRGAQHEHRPARAGARRGRKAHGHHPQNPARRRERGALPRPLQPGGPRHSYREQEPAGRGPDCSVRAGAVSG